MWWMLWSERISLPQRSFNHRPLGSQRPDVSCVARRHWNQLTVVVEGVVVVYD